MHKYLLILFPALFSYGCAITDLYSDTRVEAPDNTRVALVAGDSANSIDGQRNWQVMSKQEVRNNKNINHYARGMMQELLSNLQYVNNATPVAVSSFVYLDSDFNYSSLLGRQLSEAFMHEVHKLGIPVIDYKLTNYIRVTENGDFALTKDFLELEGELPIRYILTGTLLQHDNGVLVNARVIGAESKAVVASAQGYIPQSVSDSIHSTDSNDGIYK